jgi:hypothetical protein
LWGKKKQKTKNKPKHDGQNLDVVQWATKINKRIFKLGIIYQKGTKPNICKVGPLTHKFQMRNKMVKGKMSDKGRAYDLNVIHKGRENTRGRTFKENTTMHKNGLAQKKAQ